MDSVAAAFVDMQNTDVLLYAPGTDHLSWVPRWDRAMLFRNPFRFGKALPWSPSLDLKPTWSINAESKVLALRGVLGRGFGLERRMTRRVVTTLKRAMLVTAEDTCRPIIGVTSKSTPPPDLFVHVYRGTNESQANVKPKSDQEDNSPSRKACFSLFL
ncbi:hypothetical protein IWW34DRAFT_785092 [Fusarium oxysporum f. sp. albedinis]|nr:hypothetical protein IWW34DRAFT_785092 [Fusarium oxysporum f. sp. albedinis]